MRSRQWRLAVYELTELVRCVCRATVRAAAGLRPDWCSAISSCCTRLMRRAFTRMAASSKAFGHLVVITVFDVLHGAAPLVFDCAPVLAAHGRSGATSSVE